MMGEVSTREVRNCSVSQRMGQEVVRSNATFCKVPQQGRGESKNQRLMCCSLTAVVSNESCQLKDEATLEVQLIMLCYICANGTFLS